MKCMMLQSQNIIKQMLSQKYLPDPLGCWQQIYKQDQLKLLKKLVKGRKQQVSLRPRDPIITQVYVGWEQDKQKNGQKKRIKTETNLASRSHKFRQSFADKQYLTEKQTRGQYPHSKSVQLPFISKNTYKTSVKDESGRVSDFKMYELKAQQIKQDEKLTRTKSNVIDSQKMRKKLIGVVEKVFKDRQGQISPNEDSRQRKQRSTKNKIGKKLKLQRIKRSENMRQKQKQKQKQKEWKKINILQLQTYFSRLSAKKNNESMPFQLQQHKDAHSDKIYLPKKDKIPDFIRQYKSINPIIDVDVLVKRNNFKILVDQDSLYFGNVQGESKVGVGVFVCKTFRFQGTWKNDQKFQGYQITSQGYYKGRFKAGLRNGQGQFVWRNGEKYQGQWNNGHKHGSGIWKSGKGDSYIGQWNYGKVQGYGVHISSNGQRYQGLFQNFLKNGRGKQTFPNGDVYEGDYRHGKPCGKGKYIWKNEAVTYEGEFVQGYRHGKGIIKAQNYMKYTGQFIGDKAQGKGQIEYNNGDIFMGQFKQGKKHGKGTIKQKNSHKIVAGIWKNDELQEDEPI